MADDVDAFVKARLGDMSDRLAECRVDIRDMRQRQDVLMEQVRKDIATITRTIDARVDAIAQRLYILVGGAAVLGMVIPWILHLLKR